MSDGPLYIHPELRRFARPIGALLLDEYNARLHPTRNLAEITNSLRDHGQTRVAVVLPRAVQVHGGKPSPAGTVIIGNGMLAAARSLGWSHLAAIDFSGKDEDAAKLALRDNRTSELAEWDFKRLSVDMTWLADLKVDLSTIGWAEHESGPLLAATWAPINTGGGGGQGPDDRGDGVHGEHKTGIHLTAEQRAIVDRAIAKARAAGGSEMTDGEALVMVCEAYTKRRGGRSTVVTESARKA